MNSPPKDASSQSKQLLALKAVCETRFEYLKKENGLGEACGSVLRYLEAWKEKWCKDWPEAKAFVRLLEEYYKEMIR